MLQCESTLSPVASDSERYGGSQRAFHLFGLLVLVALDAGVSSAASAINSDGVRRLPVIDSHDIHFSRLTSGGEMLNSWVRAITQDKQGFIWLASDTGLYRYDGYVFKQYRHDPDDPDTVGSDEIKTVFADREGFLWIGTISRGVDRFDPTRAVFEHFRHDSRNGGSLSSDIIQAINQDSRGTLWFATSGGLDRLDPSANSFVHYRHDPRAQDSLSDSRVLQTYEDRHGGFWVGTEQGLNKLDRATGRAIRYLHDPANPHSLGGNRVGDITEDRFGTIWTAAGNGLSALDVRRGKFTRYSYHQSEPNRDDVAGITSLLEDADGVLWLGTVRDGLLRLDRDREEFRRYSGDPANHGGLPDNGVGVIYEDREGVVWVGTKSGVSRFLRRASAFVNYRAGPGRGQVLRDNLIWSVQADSTGSLWVGTETALHRLDRKTGRVRIYRHDANNRNSLSHNTVSTIREDRSGELWFGTYGGGLNRYDSATERFTAYRSDPSKPGALSSDLVYCLLIDREGTLWVGTQFGGLNRYDRAANRFRSYRNQPDDAHSLSHDNVTTLFEDRAGALWVGTLNGLNRLDRESMQFTRCRFDSRSTRGLSQIRIRSIWEDGDGALWVGTAEGLYRREPSGSSFTEFTFSGEPLNRHIGAILEDRTGDLWLATKTGLLRVSPRTGHFRNYSELDGLAGSYYGMFGSEAACQTPDGEMVFGSTNGLSVFNPDRLSTNPYVPPVVLTNFMLFNKPVRPGQDSPLQRPIWATQSLTLTHTQSIFTLEFAALSYAAPQHNRYRYRLEGLDGRWNEVDSTRRFATYTSLPAGNYVFHVQGSNNDRLWNEAGVRLAISVLPPWWGTWWFRVSAGMCLAALIVGWHRYRVIGLRSAAKELEFQVASRTQELQAANHSAEVAREAAEAANQAKSAFLANISHELRTPLNAILGFSNLLRECGVSREQSEHVNIINRSGEHLLTLIDDVLDLAKIEAGKQSLTLAPCDLVSLVGDVAEMIRVRAHGKNLELVWAHSPDYPRYIRTDAPKLRQVLINLLGNAVKFTDVGSVTLRSSATSSGDGRFRLRFEVEDTGQGIPEEDQVRIFEPFVQASQHGAQKGTGLGLAITRRFVEIMGGVIGLESAPGRGSRFRVEIPAEAAEEWEVPAVQGTYEQCPVLEEGQPECRVLVVDDNPENAEVLQQMLGHAGFQVRVARNGALGIEQFQQWRPHFIWMDVRMPVMNGMEATRRIRELDGGREVKIAAMTASAFKSERNAVMAAGMDDFIRKPYRWNEVFGCISQHLGVRYLQKSAAAARTVEEAGLLRPAALAKLPGQLRRELMNAVLSLDARRVGPVIDRVKESDEPLASSLSWFVDRLNYTAILNAIEGSEEVSDPKGACAKTRNDKSNTGL